MKILIYTAEKQHDIEKEDDLFDLTKNYLKTFSQDQIILIVPDSEIPPSVMDDQSLQIIPVSDKGFPVLKKIKTERKILSIIREHQPDVIITTDLLSTINIPNQIYLANLIKDIPEKESKPLTKKEKEKWEKSFNYIRKILVHSKAAKAWLSNQFPHLDDKIKVLYRIPEATNKPLSYDEKTVIKEKYTEGNEFFLAAPCENKDLLIQILKGFTGFKKWQRSHMKLILSVNSLSAGEELKSLISNYRFNEDVAVIHTSEEDYPEVVGSAYAVILPDKYENDFTLPIQALNADIPLMIPEGSVYAEVISNCTFHFQYNDKDDITRVFLESFRDEKIRSGYIQIAKQLLPELKNQSLVPNLHKELEAFLL